MAESIKTAVNTLLALWDWDNPDSAPEHIRFEAINRFNAALQELKALNFEYWMKATKSLAVTAGNKSYALDSDIQKVLHPCRLSDGAILTELKTRDDYGRFPAKFLGAQTLSPGKPAWYYLDKQENTGQLDAARVTLFLLPEPDTAYTLLLDVSLEAPSFTWDDYCGAGELSMPHEYRDSIFHPVIRYHGINSRYFSQKDLTESIKEQYQAAILRLRQVET